MQSQVLVHQVSKVFKGRGGDVVALQNINLEIPSGQFVCLLGPSGCGKSTLLNAIGGFSLATQGEVKVDGQLITAPGPDRGRSAAIVQSARRSEPDGLRRPCFNFGHRREGMMKSG